jgi:hypothetical protein
MIRLLVAALIAASHSASAQVFKCPDPANGRIIYSDAPCTGGQQLERQRSQAEIMLERQQAAAAGQRNRAQDQRALESLAAPVTQSSQQGSGSGGGEGFACRQARREVEVAGSVQTGSTQNRKSAIEFARKREADACGQQYVPPAPELSRRDRILTGQIPDQLVNCDPAGCWGTSGRRYNSGGGESYWRDDGKFCSGSSTALTCN